MIHEDMQKQGITKPTLLCLFVNLCFIDISEKTLPNISWVQEAKTKPNSVLTMWHPDRPNQNKKSLEKCKFSKEMNFQSQPVKEFRRLRTQHILVHTCLNMSECLGFYTLLTYVIQYIFFTAV